MWHQEFLIPLDLGVLLEHHPLFSSPSHALQFVFIFAPLALLTGFVMIWSRWWRYLFVFCSSDTDYPRDFLCGLAITFIGWFTSLITVLIIAVFISLIGQSLSWYNHFYIAVCLYGTATVAKIILIHTLAKRFYYVVSGWCVSCFLFAAFRNWRRTSEIYCAWSLELLEIV